MPSVSDAQRRFMGAVRSYMERGSPSASSDVRRAANSMNLSQVRDFTRKPRRPRRV